MKRYRIIKTLPVAAGTVVQLSEAQARDRKGRVESLGESRYKLRELLQFKKGEEVGIDGELPKVHLDLVEVIPVGIVDPELKTASTKTLKR